MGLLRESLSSAGIWVLYLFFSSHALASEFYLAWPTPNPSFARGLGYHTFLQKTGPDKDFSSGAFGCVRNNGYKFHEGIDLFPLKTNASGYAIDTIFSAMPGQVAYLSHKPKDSAYGKYVVLEHNEFEPVLYSLYAHLSEISPTLSVGKTVSIAHPIGKMGNSASFSIPLSRSHLHFEIGLRLSNHFERWYSRQSFITKNKHGNFNGFNLVGIDPIHFFSQFQEKAFESPHDYIQTLPVVTKVRINSPSIPYLAQRNPCLSDNVNNFSKISSWICSFGPFGIPLKFEASRDRGFKELTVLSYDESADSGFCRKLVSSKNGKLTPTDQLLVYLELLFLD